MKKKPILSTGYTDLAGNYHSVEQMEAEAERKKKPVYRPRNYPMSSQPAKATPEEELAYREAVLNNFLESWEQYETDGTFERWPSIKRTYTDGILKAEEAIEKWKEAHNL